MTATLSHVTDPDARELPLGGRLLAVLDGPWREERLAARAAWPADGMLRDPGLSMADARAWTLNRFFESRMLETAVCKSCGGHFVVHPDDLHHEYVCGLCNMPARAGKTRKAKAEVQADQAAA